MLLNENSVGEPTHSKCKNCGYKTVWSTLQNQQVHTINTSPNCPDLGSRDSDD